MPNYIIVNPDNTIALAESPTTQGLSIPLVNGQSFRKRNIDLSETSQATSVFAHAFSELQESLRIKRGDEKKYALADPEAWLWALGVIVVQSVIGGAAWDTTKALLLKALAKLRANDLAPPKDKQRSKFIFVECTDPQTLKILYDNVEKLVLDANIPQRKIAATPAKKAAKKTATKKAKKSKPKKTAKKQAKSKTKGRKRKP